MAAKKTNPGKASGKATVTPKPEPAPKAKKAEPERKENRYLRASRIIIAEEGIDLDQLAKKAGMSRSTAGHCREAFAGVTQALREAKLLPVRKADAKAAVASQETPKAA